MVAYDHADFQQRKSYQRVGFMYDLILYRLFSNVSIDHSAKERVGVEGQINDRTALHL